MEHRAWSMVGMVSLILAAPTLGQGHEVGGHRHTHGDDNVEFLERSPRIGDPIPDVSGYDEEGNRVSLADFKGAYTVLICGCLT